MPRLFRTALAAALSLLGASAAAGGVRTGTGGAELPDKPLEGQRRAPCNGDKALNGG